MIRFLLSGVYSIAILILFFSSCKSPKKSTTRVPRLINTLWKYTDEDLTYTIRFLNGGRLQTTHPNETTPQNDDWSQKGKNVFLSFNDRFAVYEGQFVTNDSIAGTARNQQSHWDWSLKRIREK